MKIKLAILEKDKSYLSRIAVAFGTKYADKFEIYSFADQTVVEECLVSAKIDVLLASDAFDIDLTMLPKRCAFAYLVDSADIDMVNNQRAICKFQKADLIYKQIISVYSEKASSITGFKVNSDAGKVIGFFSPAGGVGCSTMAAACALHFAQAGKKVLFLSLEKYGSPDVFFHAEGQFDMSDVIFTLKTKRGNLHLKLESCVKMDPRGVYFYSKSKLALDMMELTAEEIVRLLSELRLTGEYDLIVMDLDFSLDKEMRKIYGQAERLVLVGNGSDISNIKTERAFAALATLEQDADAPLTSRVSMAYNKASNKSGTAIEIQGVRTLGGAPRFEGATTAQIVDRLAGLALYDSLF